MYSYQGCRLKLGNNENIHLLSLLFPSCRARNEIPTGLFKNVQHVEFCMTVCTSCFKIKLFHTNSIFL